MAAEGHPREQEEARDGRSAQRVRDDGQSGSRAGSITLGLVSAPETPTKIAEELADELPELLGRHIDDQVSWKASVVCDPLTGGDIEESDILDETEERMQREGWDLAIFLTDLPVLRGRQVIVADASSSRGVGGISLPPLGVTLLRRRAREATLQLVSEMHHGTSEADREREQRREQEDTGEDSESSSSEDGPGDENLRGGDSRQLIGRRLTERLSPIKRSTPSGEDMDVDVRFVAPRVNGRLRLVAGMVLANRPWRLFAIMKGALAAAFATGAYVLVTASIWQLGYAGGYVRMAALTVLALVAMVVWFIASHGLWERPSERGSRYLANLYNTATALTLAVAVLFSYAMLYVAVLLAALIFIDPGFFQSSIQSYIERPFSFIDYLVLAWLTSSLALVAGAVGSGLEDEETVLNATYGYRQKRRSEEFAEDSQHSD